MKKTLFRIIAVVLLLAACDGMKTEIDIDIAAFPPKLCVTAILDGASETFSIVLTEGRALADYKTPRPSGQKVVVNGEILLYENGNLILREVGEFDMTKLYVEPYFDPETWEIVYPDRGGYRFEAPVATNPGSTYRLVVATDKHGTATSTSTMPPLPNVSATINTTETVKRSEIKEFNSLGGGYSESSSDVYLWPISLQWGARPAGRNYYALEMYEELSLIEGPTIQRIREGKHNIGIWVGDLSKLQDNPEVEIFENQDIDLDPSSMNYDTYKFPILLMSDMAFTDDDASLTLFLQDRYNLHYYQYFFVGDFEEHTQPRYDYYPSKYQHKFTLRVRHITETTFRYYRSLALQSIGIDFFSEPVNIIGNIENGYGGFMVFSAVDFPLLEYESEHYY